VWKRQPEGDAGVRDLAGELDQPALRLHPRVGHRDGREQRLGVGVVLAGVEVVAGAISTIFPRYITSTR